MEGEKWKQWQILFSWAPKPLWMVRAAVKLKDTCSLEGKLWQTYTSYSKAEASLWRQRCIYAKLVTLVTFTGKQNMINCCCCSVAKSCLTIWDSMACGLLCLPLSPMLCYANSLQSCLTLCDPIDGSPPGSPVPGILQARTLEWVAISFSNTWKWKVKVKSPSRVRLLATPWTAAYQAPPSMGFSRQEYWSGVPLPSAKVCSNSCPLSQWCCLTISSSAALFSFCLQSFPASVSFPTSRLFASGGQRIEATRLASVLDSLW